jgi:hypothetical protein
VLGFTLLMLLCLHLLLLWITVAGRHIFMCCCVCTSCRCGSQLQAGILLCAVVFALHANVDHSCRQAYCYALFCLQLLPLWITVAGRHIFMRCCVCTSCRCGSQLQAGMILCAVMFALHAVVDHSCRQACFIRCCYFCTSCRCGSQLQAGKFYVLVGMNVV